MADRRGAYELVSDSENALQHDRKRAEKQHNVFLPAAIGPLVRTRRVLVLIAAGALICITFVYYAASSKLTKATTTTQGRGELAGVFLEHLSSPLDGYSTSTVGDETSVIIGEHHNVSGGYPEDYEWIDPYTREPFEKIMYTNGMNNNAMGRMPTGSNYNALIIARGRNDLYIDPIEEIEYANLTIVGFFANYVKGSWERRGPEPFVLELPVWRQYPRPCQNLVNGGAADPRFIWSDAGEPLAIIGTSSRVPGVCKAVGMVDLRAVWPNLKEHMDKIGFADIPITYDKFTEIGKASKKEKYEKNWAGFFSGPKPAEKEGVVSTSWREKLPEPRWPYFMSQVVDRSVLKVDPSLDTSERSSDSYVLSKEIDLWTKNRGEDVFADSECLFDALPSSWNRQAMHMATPFYRVTFCNRGACEPTEENTVLLGLVHYKKERRKYRRMFVTMSTQEPFKILSVSPPLHFGSVEMDEEVVFSVSMAFFPTKTPDEQKENDSPFKQALDYPGGYLAHGWLDDTIVVGAGVRDERYDAIHLPVADALRGHTLCP